MKGVGHAVVQVENQFYQPPPPKQPDHAQTIYPTDKQDKNEEHKKVHSPHNKVEDIGAKNVHRNQNGGAASRRSVLAPGGASEDDVYDENAAPVSAYNLEASLAVVNSSILLNSCQRSVLVHIDYYYL